MNRLGMDVAYSWAVCEERRLRKCCGTKGTCTNKTQRTPVVERNEEESVKTNKNGNKSGKLNHELNKDGSKTQRTGLIRKIFVSLRSLSEKKGTARK